jgi:hypothetical protein
MDSREDNNINDAGRFEKSLACEDANEQHV